MWSEVVAFAEARGFSGVARLDVGGESHVAALGHAHRALRLANQPGTRFAIASGTKGFTAATVMALAERGALGLDDPVRRFLGSDLPLVDDAVTVAHLLEHTSGVGDYLDESQDGYDTDDYAMTRPVHTLDGAEGYLRALEGLPMVGAPGARFAYSNSGFVLLAVIVERCSGRRFADAVGELVLGPAGMERSGFLRSDELPADAALGYLKRHPQRTNVLHLPVVGSGDGGMYTTAADVHRFWRALFEGRIVSARGVATLTAPRHDVPEEEMRYGRGFWLHPTGDAVMLEGCDAGVSFRTVADPRRLAIHTVLANTADGAWAISRLLDEIVARSPDG